MIQPPRPISSHQPGRRVAVPREEHVTEFVRDHESKGDRLVCSVLRACVSILE